MIKSYYLVVKKYLKLGVNNSKLLLKLFITALVRNISLLFIPYMASKIIYFATLKDYSITLLCIFLFLLICLIYVLVHHLNYVAYQNNSIYVHNKLQKMIFKKVTTFDENFTKSMSVSYVVNTAYNDVGKVMQIPDEVFDALTEIFNILVSGIILVVVNPFVGLFAIILIIISMYALAYNMNKREYYLDRQRKHEDEVSGLVGQVVDGTKEIKAFNMKEDLNKYLETYKKSWRKDYFLKRKYDDNACVLVPMILGFGKSLIYLIFIYLILKGEYNVASLVLVLGYFDNILSEGELLYENLALISGNSTRVNRIYKLLNYKNKNMLEFGNNDEDDITGKIEFKNVSFTYDKQEIMKNINFIIEPKSFTAIVGKSGSGKSTIFRLLLRLYKANKGDILLDDESIYNYSKEVYSSNVSIVTQKPFIFDMSIRENLNLVDSNIEHQIKACKRVGIHDYIMSLKNGYNTKLIGDAENISTGQKQLIALARTLLSKSEVLLFDEVTSSLDANTSKKIINILKDLKKDHTILMITHKPILMKMADDIIVIDNGKLVGRGTHQQLIKSNEYYQRLQK